MCLEYAIFSRAIINYYSLYVDKNREGGICFKVKSADIYLAGSELLTISIYWH